MLDFKFLMHLFKGCGKFAKFKISRQIFRIRNPNLKRQIQESQIRFLVFVCCPSFSLIKIPIVLIPDIGCRNEIFSRYPVLNIYSTVNKPLDKTVHQCTHNNIIKLKYFLFILKGNEIMVSMLENQAKYFNIRLYVFVQYVALKMKIE